MSLKKCVPTSNEKIQYIKKEFGGFSKDYLLQFLAIYIDLRGSDNKAYQTEINACHRTIVALEHRISILKEKLGEPPENKKPCIVVQFKQ